MQCAVSSSLITAPPRTTAAPAAPETGHPKFRPDIEGLRAVAVTLVVLSHAGVGRFAGGYVGVDVFFVISGFLITTLLIGEHRRAGRISLPRFYARRALRLLPVATVVVLATVLASWLWLPATRFKGIALDAVSSTFYGINWRLAAAGIDYLASETDPSPLQHLWSLAVEEQFYLIWPLLLLITVRSSRRLAVALGGLAVVSLALSVQQTATVAPYAYFGSHTRAWELGAGALLAVGAARLRGLPRAAALTLSWGGLAAVLTAAVRFDEQTPFPGYAAALPVLGAAAVIAGGTPGGGRGGAAALLGTPPMQLVGKLSYGWYLWHWPVLMIWPAVLPRDETTTLNLVFAGGALVLAFVTYHLVENPLRAQPWLRGKARRGLVFGLTLSLITATAGLAAGRHVPPLPIGAAAPHVATELAAASDPQARLTELITASAKANRMPSNLQPKLTEANAVLPAHYAAKCHLADFRSAELGGDCVYGDPAGARTLYLIGDSHAAHWFPAVDEAARQQGWKLVALTKAACQVPSVLVRNTELKRPYTECVDFRDKVLNRIRAERPDLVLLVSNNADNGGLIDASGKPVPRPGRADDPLWAEGWRKTFDRLSGLDLVMLQDTPWLHQAAPECVAANAARITRCLESMKGSVTEPHRRDLVAAAARASGVRVVDPTRWFCTDVCPMIIGDTLVYRDNSHLTVAYTQALAPLMRSALFPPS
ncbi:SGNH hydrolase domain-containing protein [Actinoplanes octamycinicus]|nr:acyltransferase [Actinoplanes octamycinicus]